MKKWYESKTMWISVLQWLQSCTALVTVQTFPELSAQIVTYTAMFGLGLAKAQAFIRTLPDHGQSVTAKQKATRDAK